MKTKRTITHTLGIAALLGALVALPGVASAGSSKSPVACARKEVGAATGERTQARATMMRRNLQIRKDFEARSDWKAAFADLKKAQAEYNAATRPALIAARKSAEYKQLKMQEQQATRMLAASGVAAFAGGGGRDRGGAAEVHELLGQLKGIEAEAIEADPTASEAKARLEACQATVDGLKAELDAALAADSQWSSAKQTFDSSEARLVTAKASLVSAVASEKQARINRKQARIASRIASARASRRSGMS